MGKFKYRKLVSCNIRKNRQLIRKLRICLTGASFLVVSFVGTLMCLSASYKSLEKVLLRFRNVYCCIGELRDLDRLNGGILSDNGVTDIEISANAFMYPEGAEMDRSELTDTNVGQCFMVCGGEKFQGESVSTKQVPMWMKALVFPDDTELSGTLNKTAFHKMPAEMISFGSMISGSGQIVMSERILRQFGFDDDAQKQLVGKPVSLGMICGGEKKICLKDLVLTGIISEKFAVDESPVFSRIWFSYDAGNENILYQAELGMPSDERFCVTMFVENFKDCRRLHGALLRAGYGSCGYDRSVDTAVMLDDIITLVRKAFSLMIFFFAVILLVSFIGSIFFYSENSVQNYRMLSLIGVRKSDILGIVKRELLAVSMRSYLYCILLSAAYFTAFPLILEHFMNAQISISPTAVEVGLSLLCGSAMFVVCCGISYRFMRGVCLKNILK